jgi:hypothetical protein
MATVKPGAMNKSEVLSLLEAESAVRQVVVRLNRAFDDENWETVRICLSDNFGGTAVVQDGQQATIAGADKMLAIMKQIAAQRRATGTKSMHVLGEIIVKVNADEAEVSVFQTAYLYRANEVSSPSSISGNCGSYRLRRESGAWKVVALSVDRVWLQGEPY